jgi:RNA polymerase sigma-70 factor (ECF subfamily)
MGIFHEKSEPCVVDFPLTYDMAEPTDEKLVEDVQRGSTEAVAELYRRYWRAARAAAYGVTADVAAAEDAAAEGLQAALTSLRKLKSPERLGPWLRTIVVRAARRQHSRHANWADLTAVPEQTPSPDWLERRELALLVRDAVGRLPGQLREAISLHYFEGYSVAEGARFLDIPTGTLKRRLHEGRQRLTGSCKAILQGRKPMNTDRETLAGHIDSLLAEGADQATFFELAKEAMQLRPYPHDLMHKLVRSLVGSQLGGEGWEKMRGQCLEAMRQYCRPSARTADPSHAVGRAVGAILKALPSFHRWEIAPDEVMGSFEALYGPSSPPEPQFPLPPGWAAGRSGAYVRLTRGIVLLDENGAMMNMAELLREDISQETLGRRFEQNARLADVIDLTWMEARPLELREVEFQLRGLASKVAAGSSVRFSAHEEPRYRAALRMYMGDCANPVATGGVLQAWPGMAKGADAAHVRIYAELWASVMTGAPVDLQPFPHDSVKNLASSD